MDATVARGFMPDGTVMILPTLWGLSHSGFGTEQGSAQLVSGSFIAICIDAFDKLLNILRPVGTQHAGRCSTAHLAYRYGIKVRRYNFA